MRPCRCEVAALVAALGLAAAAPAAVVYGIVQNGSFELDINEDLRIGITLDRRCDTLCILMGCAWPGRDGARVGTLTAVYADGARETLALRNGREVVDWWRPPRSASPRPTSTRTSGRPRSSARGARRG